MDIGYSANDENGEPQEDGGGNAVSGYEVSYIPWISGQDANPGSSAWGNWGGNHQTGNINTRHMDGGMFGYAGPNPKQIAGLVPAQMKALDFLTGQGQYAGGGMNPYTSEWEDARWPTHQAINNAMNMSTSYLNPFSQDAAQKYAQAYGSAHGLSSGWNPLRGEAAQYAGWGVQTAGRPISANNEQVSADLDAARKQFMASGQPMIQDQFSMMGLGRSGGAGQAMADAWAKIAADQMNASAGREENRINRLVGSQMQAADLWRGLSNDQVQQQLQGTGLMGQMAQGTQGIGSEWDQRKLQAGGLQLQGIDRLNQIGQLGRDSQFGMLDRLMQYGGTAQQTAQNVYDAQYDDYLRRQGLAENALYAPFSGVQNTVGTVTSASGGK